MHMQPGPSEINLFSPLTMRGITLKNRIVVSPMCQYCATDGFADDWHLVHLGTRAVGGVGLVFTEATAVTPEGRISPGDLGLWKDAHIEPLSRITAFIHRMGAVSGIQLAHAGRKGSCLPPWDNGGKYIKESEGGWKVVAPSPLPFYSTAPQPHELSIEEIQELIEDFLLAAKRAMKAGFKIIEIHAAHGYLLHSFLSPLSNQRKDLYGGNLENRARFLVELVSRMRAILPDSMPLFIRISASDWIEGGWEIDQSVELAMCLKKWGVDLIDVSSGGAAPHAKIPAQPGYQVPFAEKIRHQASVMTGAVGLITEVQQANAIITSGCADLVFFARELLRNPYFALQAESACHQTAHWPLQYGYALQKSSNK